MSQEYRVCPKCDGSGLYRQWTDRGERWHTERLPCPDCDGEGVVGTGAFSEPGGES